jgi:predicted dehydrogenase
VLELLAPIAAACDVDLVADERLGIGIVGAGAIVDNAHLPAYRRAGFTVAGIHDRDPARLEKVAGRHGIPAAASLAALIADPAVQVVDIAVAPAAQPDLARAVIAVGKHLLCQKPLALDPRDAADLVARAAAGGVTLAVNQQLRFDEGMLALKAMVAAGWIGTPTALTIDVNIVTDWSAWSWLVESPRLDIMFHSIHYIDLVRDLLGDPEHVFCVLGRRPGQLARGETRTVSTLVWPDGRVAAVHSNHENISGDVRAEFRVDGAEGAIRGTFGLLYDYPYGRPDTLEVNSRVLPTDGWLSYPVTRRWIPDAFAGPMGSLMRAVAGGLPPPTSGADNLRTLAVVDALYRSAETGAAERPRYGAPTP